MAVPKRKLSRSSTRSRRSQWKATAVPLVRARTPDGRTVEVPRRLAHAVERGLVDPG
jgi:large subunit ribosomal protein L32